MFKVLTVVSKKFISTRLYGTTSKKTAFFNFKIPFLSFQLPYDINVMEVSMGLRLG
jgi:hypothetical protein